MSKSAMLKVWTLHLYKIWQIFRQFSLAKLISVHIPNFWRENYYQTYCSTMLANLQRSKRHFRQEISEFFMLEKHEPFFEHLNDNRVRLLIKSWKKYLHLRQIGVSQYKVTAPSKHIRHCLAIFCKRNHISFRKWCHLIS